MKLRKANMMDSGSSATRRGIISSDDEVLRRVNRSEWSLCGLREFEVNLQRKRSDKSTSMVHAVLTKRDEKGR